MKVVLTILSPLGMALSRLSKGLALQTVERWCLPTNLHIVNTPLSRLVKHFSIARLAALLRIFMFVSISIQPGGGSSPHHCCVLTHRQGVARLRTFGSYPVSSGRAAGRTRRRARSAIVCSTIS